jgi:phosphoglycerate dehydrogenase-like enzyme
MKRRRIILNPLLIVLDDWEGRIAESACWKSLDNVEIIFAKTKASEIEPQLREKVEYIMAIRERSKIDAGFLSLFPRLRLILQTGGHAYHIDQSETEKRNVVVALGRRATAPLASVPELTIALMLDAFHRVSEGDRMIRDGKWQGLMGRSLAGKRLGILGLGRHGSRVAEIAMNAFKMEVVSWNRSPEGKTITGVSRLSLEQLLSTSDVVSIHLRLSAESKNLLNFDRLSLMKVGSVLVNTARGAIVDEIALEKCLQAGKPAVAALDVFAEEPLPSNSKLRAFPNIVMTPHIGWTVEEVFEEFAQIACVQLRQFMADSLPTIDVLRAR